MNLLLSDPAFLSVAGAVSGGGGASDPYFSNVSLLLHGDGANGSTTIVDSSPSPKTVTAFGDAQISTAQSKFGGASMYFDGAGDYLTLPSSTDLALGQNFTLEAWAWKSSNSTTGYDRILGNGGNTAVFEISATRGFVYFDGVLVTYTFNPNDSTWHHYAITREGTTIRMFIDGALVRTATSSNTFSLSTQSSIGLVGRGFNFTFSGYIDDLRITNGVARYTSNFTPPTAPFPDA